MAQGVSNINSSTINRNLNNATSKINRDFETIASGKRINRASDDPAGLAIAEQLLAAAQTNAVAARNISDGVSVANIAEGGLESAGNITSRLSELAQQSANGTLSDSQRAALNNEYQSLQSELDRIAQTTQFNGQQLLSGSSNLGLQAGTDGSVNSQINLSLPGVSSSSLGLSADISTQEGARQALEQSKAATESIAQARGSIGATVSRLDTAYESVKTSEVNQREAESRIRDADYAEATARLVRNRIAQQADVALAAQSNNTSANSVLKLLS